MGLIHTRAAKQANRARADFYKEQAMELRGRRYDRRRETDLSRPWWRQRTVGAALRVLAGQR